MTQNNGWEKLKMHSMDKVKSNVEKIAALFPNCVTERYNSEGKLEHAIDFDKLRQELSSVIVSGPDQRYEFSWPDKRKAMLVANAPIDKTLRPCREESVDFDNTQNLYIEGDNLEVLKLLQETYLGKIKMIYIDPPYNTGNDFVYEDDFAQDAADYKDNSGQYDDAGNRMVKNLETNGRFHTDWLNMMYPRLKLAKDLLSDDGLLFVSIGDEEVDNFRKILDEIFGESNFRNQITIRRGSKSVQAQFDTWDKLGQGVEYILLYSKNSQYRFPKQMKKLSELKTGSWNNHWRSTDRPTMRYELFGIIPEYGQWRWGLERSFQAIENYKNLLKELNLTEDTVKQEDIDKWARKQESVPDLLRLSRNGKPEHYLKPTDEALLNNYWGDLLVGSSSEISKLFNSKVFDTAKLTSSVIRMLKFSNNYSIILDFFSGSATTAHAVMQLNAEDQGKRKFIMVQLPELCDESSEAYKAGYKNICEIGKERIRRAGKKIKDENPLTTQNLDIGFRVLKCDSSNMKNVYYTPMEYNGNLFDSLEDNIKEGRTPEDLLFQIMLDLGIMLSEKIVLREIAGKKVYDVNDGYLLACFDENVTEEVVTAVAKQKPYYFVLRDKSLADDSVAANFRQIFEAYSPQTERRVL